MLDMLTLSRKTGIWPERDVIKYIRSAIAADGLITRFAPGFNVGRYLEEVCQRWVAWETRRTGLRYESLTALAASSGRLADDGAGPGVRGAGPAHQRRHARLASTSSRPSPGDRRDARRTVRLIGVVVAFTALFELTAPAPQMGVNLYTAQAALMVVALVVLADSVRRLAGAD